MDTERLKRRDRLRPDTEIRDRNAAERHLWEIVSLRDVLVFVGMAGCLWLALALWNVLLPVLMALILAHIINPFVTRMERRWRWPRPLTVTAILISLLLIIVGLLAWLGPLLYKQTTTLATNLPGYLRTLATAYGFESEDLVNRVQQMIGTLQLEPKQVLGQLFQTTGRAVAVLTFLFNTTTYWALFILLVAILLFYFSWHFNRGLAGLRAFIPESRRDRTLAILGRMDEAVGDFFRGRLVIAVIMGIILSAGWFFTGVPYWFFLGMLTGLLNIVPYLSIVSWPVAVLLKYVDSLTNPAVQNTDVLAIVAWPSLVYVAVQLLESWWLTPWIQSGQTNLSAVTIILVVIAGGVLAGILGMLLAIPVSACIKILVQELVLPPLKQWAATH
jgi:predicted PurR-regulated permease PerM